MSYPEGLDELIRLTAKAEWIVDEIFLVIGGVEKDDEFVMEDLIMDFLPDCYAGGADRFRADLIALVRKILEDRNE